MIRCKRTTRDAQLESAAQHAAGCFFETLQSWAWLCQCPTQC